MSELLTKMEKAMERTGGCICGAVRFTARDVPAFYGICHCPTCRRWTGSALLEVSVETGNISWEGTDHIATRATSDHAERAWCRECGTGLWFRQTKQDEWFGGTDLPLGLFDDPAGFTLAHEVFIDARPDSFSFAGEGHKKLTRSEVVALNPDVAEI